MTPAQIEEDRRRLEQFARGRLLVACARLAEATGAERDVLEIIAISFAQDLDLLIPRTWT